MTSAASREIDSGSDTFTLFAFTWGVSVLFHQAVFFGEWFHPGVAFVPGWLLSLSALLLICQPSNPLWLALLALLDIVWQLEQMPYRPNHIFFTFAVNLSILLAIGRPTFAHAVSGRERAYDASELDRGSLLNRFAGSVRAQAVLLYAFAALAKLNQDFLNPDVSCAAIMVKEAIERLGLTVGSGWLPQVAIWATIVSESFIAAALVAPRTRPLGIIFGSLFHLIVALHPEEAIYSFSAMATPLYVLFAPPWFATEVKRWWHRRVTGRGLRDAVLMGSGLAVALVVITVIAGPAPRAILRAARFGAWLIWAVFALTLFCALLVRYRQVQGRPALATRRGLFSPAWVATGLVLFTGVNPYVGLRTQTAFTMFSNLRTEGSTTNHFFVPAWWDLTNWQDDLVQPIAASHPLLLNGGDQLPYFAFRDLTSSVSAPFWVHYRRAGQEFAFNSVEQPNHELLQRHSWILRKWFVFRQVDGEGPMKCRH